jgi:ribonuclease R
LAPPRSRRPHRREAFSREQILDFLRAHPGADRRSVARELRLKGDERVQLKILWRELADAGLLPQADANADAAPRVVETGTPPDVMLVRIETIDLDSGEAIAEPVEWARAGAPPRIRLSRFDAAGLAAGGRALVRVGERAGRVWRARLLRTAPDLPERIVGVVRHTRIGRILEPADKKLRLEFLLADEAQEPPADGELVVAAPLAQRRFEKPRAKIIERLGDEDAPRAASAIALALHDIPVAFSPGALEQARKAVPSPHAGREDLRTLPLVTIDGADARDFDDAVFAEPDPENQEGFRLVVAIADVAWYVRPDTPLDRDAQLRGNSVYFPDRVVPMLPERLSNDLCSLRPAEDRPVVAVELRIDASGTLHRHRFMRATMRSAARLTYERVQAWADGDSSAVPPSLHDPLRHLYAAFRALAGARRARGTLDLDLEERAVALDAQGRISRIAPRARLDAHRLIEEFMILANVAAAEALERKHRPCLYRVHDRPSAERIDALRESLGTLGYRLAKGQVVRPALLGDVLRWAEGKPFQAMVNDLVLRSQALAVYSPENLGHFGLALPRYAHFTSPIRRYADLAVHRALIEAFGLGEGDDRSDFAALLVVGERVSRAERRAQAAERAALERYVAAFLKPQVGNSFEARISGLHRAGIFVVLADSGAEGLIPMSTLPGRWRLHPAGHSLEGPWRLSLADRIQVRLAEVVALTGALRFELDHAPPEGHEARRQPRPRPHGPPRGVKRGRRR